MISVGETSIEGTPEITTPETVKGEVMEGQEINMTKEEPICGEATGTSDTRTNEEIRV